MKIGLEEETSLTRQELENYQLKMIVETLSMAKENSAFYRERLKEIDPASVKSFNDLQKIPFTEVEDLRESGREMLCVRDSEISRIVTLETSGTTADPKRVYYTEADQELTIDFFHYGMRNLVDPSDVVLILLPCKRPGSVGDLLNIGLHRLGAKTVAYGMLKADGSDIPDLLIRMDMKKVTCIVGSPTQVAELSKTSVALAAQKEWQDLHGRIEQRMRSVLLSTEYVPDAACELIRWVWDCKVFEHYGMTEMGLGGAVSCWTLEGYHPREADLYFEIIDPETGNVVPDGELGEVVFTTLTRKGMPFIRYRTGDRSRWITEPCECGSVLRRLDKVGERKEEKGAYERNRHSQFDQKVKTVPEP